MRLRPALALAAVLLMIAAGLFAASRARCLSLAGEQHCRVATTQPLVALTFDDGPTRRGLDAVLPLLAEHGARATFFVIGEEAEARPELVAAIAAGGHELGNHTFTHRTMIGRLPSTYREEIARTQAAISASGAHPAPLLRPPYGKRLFGLPLAAQAAGYRLIMWDIEDPPGITEPEVFARQVLDQVHPGAILLLHPMYQGNETARQALPLILDGLDARGYRAVTVTELLEAGGR